jgi:hypothetical protein
MGTTKVVQAGTDGQILDLRVVGYHGRLGADQTPARRGAVCVDAKDRLVEILEVRAAPLKKGASGGREVVIEVASRPPSEDAFARTGTRVGPWPARLDHFVVILGEHERRYAGALGETVVASEPGRVRSFLAWFAGCEPQAGALACMRVGELCAWYCSADEAFALWQRLAPVAREEVLRAARQGDNDALRTASLWLSRAAFTDADMVLAVAGLRRTAYPYWKAFLDAGVRSGTEAERRASVDDAERELPQAAPLRRSIAPGIIDGQHKLIDKSFELLDVA